jgi:hypothetical protein
MAVHIITITSCRAGLFDLRLGDDQRLFVESTAMPFLESATRLIAGGLAVPEDEIIMKFSDSFEIRRGRIEDAVKTVVARRPMRLIARKDVGVAPSSKRYPWPRYG